MTVVVRSGREQAAGDSTRRNVQTTLSVARAVPVARYALFVLPDVLPSISPRELLALQLKAAAPDADWNAGGVNRADELAGMFVERTNIRTLVSLTLEAIKVRATTRFEKAVVVGTTGTGDSSGDLVEWQPQSTVKDSDSYRMSNNGRKYGFLGELDRRTNQIEFQPRGRGVFFVAWSAAGDGHVGYVISSRPTGFVIVPSWGSSSDRARLTSMLGMIVGVALPLAGISAAASLGNLIVGPALAASYPTLASVVGNVALSTAFSGGNIQEAVKSAAIGVVGGAAGSFVGQGVAAATNVNLLGQVAATATNALVAGSDVKQAVAMTLLQAGTRMEIPNIDISPAPTPAPALSFGTPSFGAPNLTGEAFPALLPSSLPLSAGGSGFGGPGFAFTPSIDWSMPAASTAPNLPSAPIPSTPAVPASPAVANSPRASAPNVVNTISSAMLQSLQLVRAFKALRSEVVNVRSRVTTESGETAQADDDGLIRTYAGGVVRVTRPPVGVPYSTVSGNLIVNNGDETFTFINRSGARSVRRYSAASSSGGSSLISGSFLSAGTNFNFGSPIVLGGVALAALLLIGGRRVSR